MRPIWFILLFIPGLWSCTSNSPESYRSDTLEIIPVAGPVYRHVSFLPTNDFGRVACNGMLVRDGNEVLVFDCPTSDSVSEELIAWVEQHWDAKIKAVVANHFHVDCVGGLKAFHDRGIPSYASRNTIELTTKDQVPTPLLPFIDTLTLQAGKVKVLSWFPGPGHAPDNLVHYVPSHESLFGGCMVKCLNAPKGYLGDADTLLWPHTVNRVKKRFPKLQHVIPGHGKPGGTELLDYTIELFSSQPSIKATGSAHLPD